MICWRSSYSTAACSEGISSALHMPRLVRRTPHGASDAICSAAASALAGRAAAPAAADHVSDQPDPQSLLRVDPAPGEHQLVRARGADQAGKQPAGAHVAVGDPDVDERRPEHSLLARVADVAAKRQREPEAGRWSVDGCDHGLRERAQPEDQGGHVLLFAQPVAGLVAAVVAGGRAVAVQVQARAEAAARAGQDDRATGAVDRGPAQLLVELLAELRGHRVELIRPVESEPANVRCGLVYEQGCGHRRILFVAPPRASAGASRWGAGYTSGAWSRGGWSWQWWATSSGCSSRASPTCRSPARWSTRSIPSRSPPAAAPSQPCSSRAW